MILLCRCNEELDDKVIIQKLKHAESDAVRERASCMVDNVL